MIQAAGLMLLIRSPEGDRALFVKRGNDSDFPGHWHFPGGRLEQGETAEQAALRECLEEAGPCPHANPVLWTRQINADRSDGEQVDYTTFAARVKDEFIPTLNGENTAWTWASTADPPEPLHPGCRIALARLTMDELGIARAMASGELSGPQRYKNLLLVAIRITATGAAYRGAKKDNKGKVLREEEIVWRDPGLYLNEEFLARCNGLPVIWQHPQETEILDSQEFADRIIGSIFLPFIKGEEVWGIAKLWDDAAGAELLRRQWSTSPGVLFHDPEPIDFAGGKLLIEDKPALLDHIAICELGVWDKGGAPSGVDISGGLMTDAEKAAAQAKAQETARADSAKLDEILSFTKGFNSRIDALEEHVRKDSEERERHEKEEREARERDDKARKDAARMDRFGRKDSENDDEWRSRCDAVEEELRKEIEAEGEKGEVAIDRARKARKDAETAEEKRALEKANETKARKDAEEREEREREEKARADKARADAALLAENSDLKGRLKAVEGVLGDLTRKTSAEDRDALALAQARADAVAALFGERIDPPMTGETPLAYRKRNLERFKKHSERFKDTRLDSLTDEVLSPIEEIVYADSVAASRAPIEAKGGILVPVESRDAAGRLITKFVGDIGSWMTPFMTGGQVGFFNRTQKGH